MQLILLFGLCAALTFPPIKSTSIVQAVDASKEYFEGHGMGSPILKANKQRLDMGEGHLGWRLTSMNQIHLSEPGWFGVPPSSSGVWVAFAWGAISAAGLVLGAIAGSFFRLPHNTIALTMSVGAGLLLATASLQLATEAVRTGGTIPAVVSLLLGAAVFSTSNALLARFGAANRKRCGECTQQASEAMQAGSGMAIAAGTALDAIPESLALGLALREQAVPLGLMIAISIGNLPEALSGAAGMLSAGRSYSYIFLLWGTIALGAAVATAAAYAAFSSLGQTWTPGLQAFAAGALLAMTAETMIPEAFHNSPRFSGFLAGIGFCVLLLVEGAMH